MRNTSWLLAIFVLVFGLRLAFGQDVEELTYSDSVHLQQFLIGEGWLDGDADGAIGPRSRSAIAEYFASRDHTGPIDLTSIQALLPADNEQFEVLSGFDLPEGDYRKGTEDSSLRDITLHSCQLLCSADQMCQAYTYNVGAKVCFLKSVANAEQSFATAISGRRLPQFSTGLAPAAEGVSDQFAGISKTQSVPAGEICTEGLERLIPERTALSALHSQVLQYLDEQDIPLGGFSGDYKYDYDVQGALELLPSYLQHVEQARTSRSRDELGILLFDLVRLYYAADQQETLSLQMAARKEAEEILNGLSLSPQAADLGAALVVQRRFRIEPEELNQLKAVVANHRQIFGTVPRQWALYVAMTRVVGGYMPAAELRNLRRAALDDRVTWAKELGDARLITDATGALLAAQIDDLTLGRSPEPRQLAELLPTARSILADVERRARADLVKLLPVYQAGTDNEPCRSVSKETVQSVLEILLAEGTADERKRVVEFGVLHTLNRHMFATETAGVLEMSRSLLALRLVNPEIYRQAASYLSVDLLCPDEQPNAACVNESFASVYATYGGGQLALDFSRDAYAQTVQETSTGSAISRQSALALAVNEWRFGSVSAAADLYDAAVRDPDLPPLGLQRNNAQEVAELGYDIAVAALDVSAVESAVVGTIENRRRADAEVPDGTFMAVDAPSPHNMVLNLLLGRDCAECSTSTYDVAYQWLQSQLDIGSPWALLLQRTRSQSDQTRMDQAIKFLERLFGPRPNMINYEQGALRGLSPASFADMRSPPMDAIQLANVLALSQVHPQLTALSEIWATEFVRFMVEPDLARKRQQYDYLLTVEDSVSLEFGDDSGYMAGLASFSEVARLIGYNLAAQVVDEHLLRMFDERQSYLSEQTRAAAASENADLIVPTLARLARAAYESEDYANAHALLDRLHAMSAKALEGNWSNGDERVVIKFRRIESALRLAAQLRTKMAANEPFLAASAFEALQLAMLGDTALTAQASQRRRLLVDGEARSALQGLQNAQSQLTLFQYYRDFVGISDPVWETNTLNKLSADLRSSEVKFSKFFPDGSGLTLQPMPENEVKASLETDEALLVLHSGTDGVFGTLVTNDTETQSWWTDVGSDELAARVSEIRLALDLGADSTPKLEFPFVEANALLADLLGPAQTAISGYDRLFIIVDGPLQTLPLGVLPTRIPEELPRTLDDYRSMDIGWFGIENTLLYLPTVNSIRSRETINRSHSARKPFAGIGNPNFSGDDDNGAWVPTIADLATASGLADQAALRKLSPLLASELEVRRLAEISGATIGDDTLLGSAATESAVKDMALDDYNVLLFATHGITSGAVSGTSEPGLALSPPNKPTALDDGYLALSDVMSLELNAEIVILSACNTASGDGRGTSSGLSGLARGFLGAGAQSVAVTHWSIPSAATVALNVQWFEAQRLSDDGDWAKALRGAMAAMVDNIGDSRNAHPSYWGAFVIFGAPTVN